jgi:ATP-dependent DNA ligase
VKTDAFDENVTPEEMSSFWWVNPQFEVAVQYSEWTRFGSLRHPEFYSFDEGFCLAWAKRVDLNKS